MAKGCANLSFQTEACLEEEENISARVALVPPGSVCELQTVAKARGYKDAKLAFGAC